MKKQKGQSLAVKIKNNFLVVSNYNNDIDWIKDYTDNYIVYDRSDDKKYIENIDPSKIKKSPNIGYNLYDYFTFIIDNYYNLPDCTIFIKGNVFPRHVKKEFFDRIINNSFFTPIEDYKMHNPTWPKGFFSSDGGFCEINESRYIGSFRTKYFNKYNDFLKICFKDPVIPKYIRFAPGGNYIVPRANILKLPKVFYENLLVFVSHDQLPGEAHIIERSLHTLWTCNFELNEKMLAPIDRDMTTILPQNIDLTIKKIIPVPIRRIVPRTIKEIFVNFIKIFFKH
jgi:hypothetical protein